MTIIELHKYDRMPAPDPKRDVLPPFETLYPRPLHIIAPKPFWRAWLDGVD